MDISDSITIAAMGMKAQATRMRVITENLANADTTPINTNENPYTRQIITFRNTLDSTTGVPLVKVSSITPDTKTPFGKKYMPGHPGADSAGYVKTPNVENLIEIMDAREAQRSYEANLGMIDQARTMIARTIDLLRG